MDQLLVGHVGKQAHHGHLGVGSVHLLTGAQYWRLGALQQEEYLTEQPTESHRETQDVTFQTKPLQTCFHKIGRLPGPLLDRVSTTLVYF